MQTQTLKLFTPAYLDDVVELIYKLFKSSVYWKVAEFNPNDVKETILKVFENDGSVVMLMDNKEPVGVIAASYMLQLFNKKEKTAVELAFWIEPEYRSFKNMRLLLGAYKYWAKMKGCTSILMGKLKNDKDIETYNVRRL